MKRLLLIGFFISTMLSTGFSQSASFIYKVKLTDKGNSVYTTSKPSDFLSAKSIERRLLQQIPVNESDLPVNPGYIKSIEASGAKVIYSSKWLNLLIISVDNRLIADAIADKPFVRNIIPADYLIKQNRVSSKKPFFDIERLDKHVLRSGSKRTRSSKELNYGASLNQAQMIKVDQLHEQGFLGNGMTIAVIDAGFNSANVLAAFDSLFTNGQILGTRDFVQPGNDVYNTSISTHGMMVLSTMGGYLPGQLIGTAPKASYFLLRSEDAGSEYLMEEYYWVNAAEYADSVGVDIINSSLGYTEFDNPEENHVYGDMDGNTAVVTIGADMAASKGILVVNSAGNSGNDPWLYIGAPADGDSVFTIGAVNPDGQYAFFSSIGPTADGRIKPDVSAQGVSTIVATIPSGVGGSNGTSFSSPVMAGAAACLWQANPSFSNIELMNAIKMSGSQSSNPDNYKGWGIPDLMLAGNLLTSSQIQKEESFSKLTVFPIPFTDHLSVEVVSSNKLIADIKIISTIGETVAELIGVELNKGKNMIGFNQLDKLRNGLYMLQISDGYFVITEKVVK